MNKKRGFVRTFAFIVCLIFAGANIGFTQEGEQQFQGFNLQGYTNGGHKAWDVEGETADILGNTIRINKVIANTYGDDPMNLTAETGVIDKQSGNIHLETDVVITTESGAKMTTDTLDWERDNDLVTTDDFATITHEGMIATGTGVRAHPELKLAQMNEDVEVKVNTEPKKAQGRIITITCDGPMEVDQVRSMAVFNENVVAIEEGRELKADIVELYFDPQTNKIKKMICIGNVEVTQGDNKSYSDRAVYDAATQKLTLEGRPKLILVTEGEDKIPALGE